MISTLSRLLPAICLLCLASTARAEERAVPIRDDAGVFRADTIADAERKIDDIRRTYERNVFVNTVPSASAHERKWFRFLWTRQVNRRLEEQAQKRASEAGVDGIYVVIRGNPKDVHIVVRPGDDPQFTPHDAEELRRAIARRLRDSGPDPALLALIDGVRVILQTHAERGQSTSVVNEFVLAGLLGGGVGLWLLLCLIRYKTRPASAGVSPALLGAMFGCPAGLWIYDKLYPRLAQTPEPAVLASTPAEGFVEKADGESPPVEEHPEDAPVSP